MYLLNYIYFFVITLLGYSWLTAKEGAMTNPLNKAQKMKMTGPEMFWVLTFSTGLLAFSAPAGLDLMALRLLVLEMFLIIGLFIVKTRVQWSIAIIIYAIYISWLIIGLTYSPAPSYGMRVILKYIYPFLIMLFASAVVRDKEVFLKAGIGARTVGVVSIIFAFSHLEQTIAPGVFWYGTARAINYISICVFSAALFFFTNKKKSNIVYTLLFILPCFLWVFRTSIVGTGLALMGFAFFKYKLKALPIILGMLIAGGILVFSVPSLKNKMFFDATTSISNVESNHLSIKDINTNGRTAVWEWSLSNFYSGHKLVGVGTGNLQDVFYSLEHPFGTIKIVHNDYVQILCDNGLIGLTFFCLSFLFLIAHAFIIYNNKNYDTSIRICAIVAGSSSLGVLFTMFTDNVINYSMATISYPCGFYGMMLGMLAKDKLR